MMEMRYWLMKSEPSDVSIDDLASMPDQTVAWYGVRNYQARNFMRDQMRVGDGVFFYHSTCEEPGIAGIAEVSKLAYPDATQFDRENKYFDPKATPENPRWFNVDVRLVRKTRLVGIKELRSYSELGNMRILQKGNRLSITPIDPAEWDFIMGIL
ncbi:putative RNA-binding protein with PUA-like domain [Nitrosospira multiformis]|jgi:predicted RNA-binding protein with PUA-like domain|uniref:Predicted RNA-binding protein, contains PUA-like domain n=2 Tax=Nitrosospira multiformis TaxID=1231 RepID=A0A1I7F7T6_9PROT|nr:putative RNA-binding protein with PUA-like domain [Nitrosospira multiformis]SFU32230.1 Predicted RNA-binding protein, contains PUA-like domain [Nitrosospira multiformis]